MGWIEDGNEYLNYSEADVEKKLLEKKDEMDKLIKEDLKNSVIEEAKEENNPSEEDIKKMEQYIEENYEELVPEQYVLRGSTLKCSCGSHDRKLDMLKDHVVYVEGFPMVHELDKELEKNIKYFGVCSSGSLVLKSENVKLVKIVYDEEGNPIEEIVKGTKCIPHIIGNWRDTKEDVRIVDNGDKDGVYKFRNAEDENKGYRAVTTKSFLICRHGGIIEPLDSGQVMIEDKENNQENTEIEETENDSVLENATPFVSEIAGGVFVENGMSTFVGKNVKKVRKRSRIRINTPKVKSLKIENKDIKINNNNKFVGEIRGEIIVLNNITTIEKFKYNKRNTEDLKKLRNKFNNTKRSEFLKQLSKTENNLKDFRFSDNYILKIKDGKVPNGWQVHHKLPLDDGGTNDFENLVLIKN